MIWDVWRWVNVEFHGQNTQLQASGYTLESVPF